jgi:ferrous iron transport protein B
VAVAEGRRKHRKERTILVEYGAEVEQRIKRLERRLSGTRPRYPRRWAVIKLLEGDGKVMEEVSRENEGAIEAAVKYAKELEELHGHPCSVAISCERYSVSAAITREVMKRTDYEETLSEKIDGVTIHKYFGYPAMLAVMLLLFFSVFTFGDFLSGIISPALEEPSLIFVETIFGTGIFAEFVWSAFEGMIAGVAIALPYIIPFYVALSFLEDSGYLSRVAFLTDNIMHKLGLHGKAFIPLILGYGCNVPACLGCRIMERQREKNLTAFLATLVPCSARTVIIMGLVGAYVGIEWALALYVLNIGIIFTLGKLTNQIIPGEPVGLIMEMHPYRLPSVGLALKQAWFRVREFIVLAFPLIIASSLVIKILELTELLGVISDAISPVTSGWLGLPPVVGILLIFGILRKELIPVILAAVVGTSDFSAVLTPLQMFTLALVSMLYVPCIATVAALKKELGWRNALLITCFEIAFAVVFSGIVMRILASAGLP